MEDELNNLVKLIEQYFVDHLWNFAPPISDIDFKLVILSQKIIELRNNLGNIKNFDISISQIMTYMEGTFNIPLLQEKDWIKKNSRNNLVYTIYCRLSNLRSL